MRMGSMDQGSYQYLQAVPDFSTPVGGAAGASVGAGLMMPELTSVTQILQSDLSQTISDVNAMPTPPSTQKILLWGLAAVAVVVVAGALFGKKRSA